MCPNWRQCGKTTSCFGRGFVGRFSGDRRGDTGRQPTATPKNALGTRNGVTLKSRSVPPGSKMGVLTC